MRLAELLFVAALLGVPSGLLWISWHRYGVVSVATGSSKSLAWVSFALLSLTSTLWLLFYAVVLISEYNKGVYSIVRLGPRPATLAVPNILVCAASFMLSLFVPKTVQGAVPFRTAITFATGYMVLVWMFALTAH